MKKLPYIIIVAFVLLTQASFAQEGEYITVKDFESWSALSLQYKLKHNWKIGIEEQLRLSNNSSEIDAYFTELSTDYYFSTNVYGAIGFRHIRNNDTQGDVQGFENHMRLHFDLGYEFEKDRLDVEYRLRFQTKNELGITAEQGDFANNHLRLKLGLKYNIKKWKLDPEFSTEIFRHYEQGEINGFDKFRVTLGTKYKIKDFGKISAFYRIEKELNSAYPKTTYIAGLKYAYTLRSDRKRIKTKKDKEEKVIWY